MDTEIKKVSELSSAELETLLKQRKKEERKLEKEAKDIGISFSELVRRILDAYLEKK